MPWPRGLLNPMNDFGREPTRIVLHQNKHHWPLCIVGFTFLPRLIESVGPMGPFAHSAPSLRL